MNYYICRTCKEEKQEADFPIEHKGWRNTQCADCKKIAFREWYKLNRQKPSLDLQNIKCTQCGNTKSIEHYYTYKRNKSGFRQPCIECSRETSSKYREQNKKLISQRHAARRRRIKQQVIEMYGGICKCCGEAELDFLTIDHMKGNAKPDRVANFYDRLAKQPLRDDLQILCWNCNQAKGLFGSCPHRRDNLN